MRFLLIMILNSLILAGCSLGETKSKQPQPIQVSKVTVQVTNENQEVLPDHAVEIIPVGETEKDNQSVIPQALLTDAKGKVEKQVVVGKKYKIRVLTVIKQIKVPDKSFSVKIVIKDGKKS
ncbi:hypothetical protein [Laceyella putida]|uniref:Lipoprotein n=1 Tax=Laceyella putida TaxID=110101 RepID=A0ABW2RG60_9BACL